MLNHKGTVELKTKRLLLRPYKAEDASDIFENYATDPMVTRYLFSEPFPDFETVQTFVEEQVKGYTLQTYQWLIEYEGHVIGSLSAYNIDHRNEACEIGGYLGKAFWSKRFIREAAMAVIAYLFEEIGFHRIYGGHDERNVASGKVMISCGMQLEARFRESIFDNGTYYDALQYSILSSEFKK